MNLTCYFFNNIDLQVRISQHYIKIFNCFKLNLFGPSNIRMEKITEQFKFEEVENYFEQDTHNYLIGKVIDDIRLINGKIHQDDTIIVTYKNCPYITIYDWKGRIIDLDYHLNDNYKLVDEKSGDKLLDNLSSEIKSKISSPEYSTAYFNKLTTSNSYSKTLTELLGITFKPNIVKEFFHKVLEGEPLTTKALIKKFSNFIKLVEELSSYQRNSDKGYVHFTDNNNIVITPLTIQSGISVIIELSDFSGMAKPNENWIISHTGNPTELQNCLIFRSKDIRSYFDDNLKELSYSTDRYELTYNLTNLSFDSLLDQTENKLTLNTKPSAYHNLPSDKNIFIALLTNGNLAIINTYLSISPAKWLKEITLKGQQEWIRGDENLTFFISRNNQDELWVNVLIENVMHPIAKLGKFKSRFELSRNGGIIILNKEGNLVLIKTNIYAIDLGFKSETYNTILKEISELFKGNKIFTEAVYAQKITQNTEQPKQTLDKEIDEAKFNFEVSIDHMLVEADNDIEKIKEIKVKIGVARSNIREEITKKSEGSQITLAGQRLRYIINSIIGPSETKVNSLLERLRVYEILQESRLQKEAIKKLDNPDTFKDILNQFRAFDRELNDISTSDLQHLIKEFKQIYSSISEVFASQIAKDQSTIKQFIIGELSVIEKAIDATFDINILDTILNVHPASIELFELLKQPHILNSITSQKELSPVGIQARLFNSINQRKNFLLKEQKAQERKKHASKMQLAEMIEGSMLFFVENYSGDFSELILANEPNYIALTKDIKRLEIEHSDLRLASELRRKFERLIYNRNREDLKKKISFEGKYAFVKNDPDLYVDLDSEVIKLPTWSLDLTKSNEDQYRIKYTRSSDKEVFIPSLLQNLQQEDAYHITAKEFPSFIEQYNHYSQNTLELPMLSAALAVARQGAKLSDFTSFSDEQISSLLPKSKEAIKALHCSIQKKKLDAAERSRNRFIPEIPVDFIDETPYFSEKLIEFFIKAKLQLISGSGIILLSGPPSTGKSAFLKFAAATMNREYFEHASDKWQTKNSLVSTIKFGDKGPYTIPSGFTKAITTPYSLVNIEEIKEWPEALRKSLNPFFAGSNFFIAPDGSKYEIGTNILLCAAANLGSIYRQDDEPFTADFWSRVEVIDFDYAPYTVDRDYFEALKKPKQNDCITIPDLVKQYFRMDQSPNGLKDKAAYLTQQFIEFILIPKSDEKIKRENLNTYISEYFLNPDSDQTLNAEETAKIALRRLKILQEYSVEEFFDLYDNIVNEIPLGSQKLQLIQVNDPVKFELLSFSVYCLQYIEGCLRILREKFYSSAGQTEIEGTNREFIKCVHLLNLIGNPL